MALQNQNKGTVILTWNRAVCEEGIYNYRIYLNGKVAANTISDTNTYTFNNMPFNVLLSFYVVAITNISRVSNPSNVETIILTDTNKEMLLNYSLDFFI